MNTTSILSVRFFIKKYKAKNSCAPVYARITVEGKSVDVSLKRDIEINSWNPSRGLAKGNREEIRSFNTYLEQVRADITTCYSELKIQKKLVTPVAIKNRFCGIVPPEHTLKGLIEYHNNYLKDMLEWGTMKNYMTTQKYVDMFLKQVRKTADVALSELSYSFLADFEIFLKEYKPKDHHKPCGHNTVLSILNGSER